jgi:hypothetical protein
MHTENKSDQQNIFNLLSTADKELVHSSMLRFFIESKHFSNHFYTFLGLPIPKERPSVELEHSAVFFDKDGSKIKLRFDIYVTKSEISNKPEFIIENKFKATPTVEQIKLYDSYLNNKKLNNTNKYLFVFSEDQVADDVKTYCDTADNKWRIISYLSNEKYKTESNKKSSPVLLEWLDNHYSKLNLDDRSRLLVGDYLEYLKDYKNKINKLILSPIYFKYNQQADRFIYFQYLLFLQKELHKKILEKLPLTKISLSHDGGKNTIPGIAFWATANKEYGNDITSVFVAIDGSTLKVGFSYFRNRAIYTAQLINKINTNLEKSLDFSNCFNKTVNSKSLKKEESNVRNKESVYSLFTFQLKENCLFDKTTEDMATIAVNYFKQLT